MVDEDDIYQQAQQTAFDQLKEGVRLGGGSSPDRSSLHER
jgi:hypothetical protein